MGNPTTNAGYLPPTMIVTNPVPPRVHYPVMVKINEALSPPDQQSDAQTRIEKAIQKIKQTDLGDYHKCELVLAYHEQIGVHIPVPAWDTVKYADGINLQHGQDYDLTQAEAENAIASVVSNARLPDELETKGTAL